MAEVEEKMTFRKGHCCQLGIGVGGQPEDRVLGPQLSSWC